MELESQGNTSLNQAGNIALVALVVVALMLSYFLYHKITSDTAYTQEGTQTQNGTEERQVLNMPSKDASPEELQAHHVLVEKLAVNAGEVAIGANCGMSPIVLKIQLGKDVVFKNNDSVDHIITFTETRSFAVAANTSVTVPADFGQGVGTYSYMCDTNTAAVGVVSVVE
jgi:plastocyanin